MTLLFLVLLGWGRFCSGFWLLWFYFLSVGPVKGESQVKVALLEVIQKERGR